MTLLALVKLYRRFIFTLLCRTLFATIAAGFAGFLLAVASPKFERDRQNDDRYRDGLL